MIALDASVVIALLDARDAHHDRAVALLHDQVSDGFVMHPINLAEVLVGAARNGHGAQRLAELTATGIRAADSDPSEPLFLAELRATTLLSLPDCCALSVALRSGAQLATFDVRLSRAAEASGVQLVSTSSTRRG